MFPIWFWFCFVLLLSEWLSPWKIRMLESNTSGLEDGAPGKWLSHVTAHVREANQYPRLPPCRDSETGPSVRHTPPRTLNLLVPWSWTSQPIKLKAVDFYCSNSCHRSCLLSTQSGLRHLSQNTPTWGRRLPVPHLCQLYRAWLMEVHFYTFIYLNVIYFNHIHILLLQN